MPTRKHDRVYFVLGRSAWGEGSPARYVCAWCDSLVAATTGTDLTGAVGEAAGLIRLCSNCGYPSFIDGGGSVIPAVAYGESVSNAPPQVKALYDEVRSCVSVASYHAAVMVCRKILMNVAVLQGAPQGQQFVQYVDYLVLQHLVPPNSKAWVDEIRQIGNDANHEIFEITAVDAKAAVDFVSALLKIVYEYPARGAASVEARAQKDAKPT